MVSPYQEFARKARERFLEKQKKKAVGTGQYIFTLHAQYKMRQYGLSEQRIKNVLRHPERREEGIAPNTIAVMQPVSVKRINGKAVWKQEIWAMYQQQSTKNNQQKNNQPGSQSRLLFTADCCLKIISAWRYPGVSPKRQPVPAEILRELEDEGII